MALGLVVSSSMFSEYWYRVAKLRPALKPHVTISRHSYGGEQSWVLLDGLNGTQHLLGPAAYFLVTRMDGRRTVQDIWESGMAELDESAPDQAEFIALLDRLHGAELLQTNVSSDLAAMFDRARRIRLQRSARRFMNPLYFKLSLFDPDRLLDRFGIAGRLIFSRACLWLWLAAIVSGVLLLNSNWRPFVSSIDHTFTAPGNLVLLAVTFVVMKALHELAHGLAVKRWGGEVHDMGVAMLVLLPVPYVDASAASGFADKYKRISTSAVGIMVELFLASLALIMWVLVEPGFVRQLAGNVIVIGAVSSVLFNGNPLLKFDGYYVLADLIEIPNLASRSQSCLGHLVRRLLIGPGYDLSPAYESREMLWLCVYGVASALYRIGLLILIALYLSESFLAAGLLLGAWAILAQIIWPALRGARAVARIAQSALERARVCVTAAAVLALAYVCGFLIPMPNVAHAQGIVWLSESSVVRSAVDCFVSEILVVPGAAVEPGTPLFDCENDSLRTKGEVLRAELEALRRQYRGYGLREQVKRKLLADEIASLDAELKLVRERVSGLRVVSQAHGSFVPLSYREMSGRFFEKGETLGYVLRGEDLTIKAALRQEDVDLIAAHKRVEVRFSGAGPVHEAVLSRQVPAPTDILPNAALGTLGGGSLAVDRDDPQGLVLEEPVYLVDVDLADAHIPRLVGLRTQVLFAQPAAPLAWQWSRSLRRLFMRRLDV